MHSGKIESRHCFCSFQSLKFKLYTFWIESRNWEIYHQLYLFQRFRSLMSFQFRLFLFISYLICWFICCKFGLFRSFQPQFCSIPRSCLFCAVFIFYEHRSCEHDFFSLLKQQILCKTFVVDSLICIHVYLQTTKILTFKRESNVKICKNHWCRIVDKKNAVIASKVPFCNRKRQIGPSFGEFSSKTHTKSGTGRRASLQWFASVKNCAF